MNDSKFLYKFLKKLQLKIFYKKIINLITVLSSRIACRASGRGCSCCRNYLSSATRSSSCCANSRWSSCIGIITLPSCCTPGSRIRSTPRPRDGTSWWITAFTRSCTATTLSRRCDTGHLKRSLWWLLRYSLPKWWSVALSTYLRISTWRAVTWTATSLAGISILASLCIWAILSYSRNSSIRRTWLERKTRSTLLIARLITLAITTSSKPTKAVLCTLGRLGVLFSIFPPTLFFYFPSSFFLSLFLSHAAGRRSHTSRIYLC